MTDKKTFKGFSLNSSGDILGAFPTVEIIQERAKDLMNEVTGNINQMTIDYCLKFNIDPDVLIKQKAEIELLQMKNKELEKENAELKDKLTAIRNAKDKYDMSKNKSIINAFGAEYALFCDLERILEDWQEDDQLTKATEILKEFCTYRMYDCDATREDGTYEAFEGLRKQAEQFLQEETK